MKPVKISALQVSDIKRVKAVKLDCTRHPLTVIGGNNAAGKTSVLDAIAFALGGERYKPTNVKREGSALDPELRVELSNGLIVERKGKNSTLKVIDPSGKKGGQKLLSEFVHEFALNLPKFMDMSPKQKAQAMLDIIGVGDELTKLDQQERALYEKRHIHGQICDQKKKYADELESFPDVPEQPVSASDLIKSQQAVLLKNAENQKSRDRLENNQKELDQIEWNINDYNQKIVELQAKVANLETKKVNLNDAIEQGKKTVAELEDESTAQIEAQIDDIESLNNKIRTNLEKEKAIEEAAGYQDTYNKMSEEIEAVRKKKLDLLNGADLPLDGLSIDDGELTYNGSKWDCMSGAERMIVATAIVRKLNPNCGFVLLDKLEQMDLDTLKNFNEWLDAEGLQAIATRVSTGEECTIVIEDGVAVMDEEQEVTPKTSGFTQTGAWGAAK